MALLLPKASVLVWEHPLPNLPFQLNPAPMELVTHVIL